jgi:hypothetical protein
MVGQRSARRRGESRRVRRNVKSKLETTLRDESALATLTNFGETTGKRRSRRTPTEICIQTTTTTTTTTTTIATMTAAVAAATTTTTTTMNGSQRRILSQNGSWPEPDSQRYGRKRGIGEVACVPGDAERGWAAGRRRSDVSAPTSPSGSIRSAASSSSAQTSAASSPRARMAKARRHELSAHSSDASYESPAMFGVASSAPSSHSSSSSLPPPPPPTQPQRPMSHRHMLTVSSPSALTRRRHSRHSPAPSDARFDRASPSGSHEPMFALDDVSERDSPDTPLRVVRGLRRAQSVPTWHSRAAHSSQPTSPPPPPPPPLPLRRTTSSSIRDALSSSQSLSSPRDPPSSGCAAGTPIHAAEPAPRLPTVRCVEHPQTAAIAPQTLAKLLRNEFDHVRRLIIIDW